MTATAAGVAKRYRGVVALDAVDIELARGVTGLLGPNGAGKTTLLRILATALAPDRGEIRIFGADPSTPAGRLAVRRRLGYLPQDPGFHERFSAFEFVDYVAILKEWTDRRARHDEVRRTLELVGLTDVMHRKIRKLSGGMRRRVGIAQALIGRPDLLVLDEPTAGLDPAQRLRFRELLGTNSPDATVLLSTHQTDDVAALCRHVVVLIDGRVRFSGAPSSLAQIAHDRVWVDETRDPRAQVAWVSANGDVRHVGDAPPGAQLVEPTLEDGYLLLAGPGGAATDGAGRADVA